jgi:hypothetical protein
MPKKFVAVQLPFKHSENQSLSCVGWSIDYFHYRVFCQLFSIMHVCSTAARTSVATMLLELDYANIVKTDDECDFLI